MSNRFLLDASARLLEQVLRFEHPTDATLAKHFKDNHQFGARDRGQLSDSVYAVIRHKRLLEWLLEFAERTPGPSQRTRRLALLGMALSGNASETMQGNIALPDPGGAKLIVQHALNTASAEDAHWLRAIAEHIDRLQGRELPDAARHNLPDWLANKLLAQFGAATFWPLTTALRQTAPLDLRVNTLKAKRNAVQQNLLDEGFGNHATALSPWGLRLQNKASLHRSHAYMQGLVEVQDEGSQLLCLLTDARRNETVVDFCAGAGGKTLALGATMRNTGRLYAFDSSASRLEGLKPRLQRSGLGNVHTMAINDEHDPRLQRLWNKVDRVLVDAPCSGLGTLRRNPDLAWRLTEQGLEQLQATQKSILQSAAKMLKPGGTLVYATCSLLTEENTAIANWWATQSNEWQNVDALSILSKHKIGLDSQMPSASATNQLQLLPNISGTDGFFIAIWQKKT